MATAVAAHSYEAVDAGELSLAAGEALTDVDVSAGDWYVPSSYRFVHSGVKI